MDDEAASVTPRCVGLTAGRFFVLVLGRVFR